MVRFFSEFPVDDPQEDSKFKNSKDSHETIDTQANDFSLADSFFDFDSIEDYFEDKPAADMAAQEISNVEVEDKSNRIVMDQCSEETTVLDQQILTGSESIIGSTSCPNESELVEIEAGESESEKLGPSSCTIEVGLGKISLVGSSQRSATIDIIDGESEMMIDEHESESSDSESADPSSPSSSSSHLTDSDSGCTSSDDAKNDKDDNEEEEKGEEKTEHNDVEIEEGEIRDSAGENLVTETTTASTDEEDVEKMVSWSGINDDDVDESEDEDGNRHATKGPIRSKNELEVLPPVPSVDVTLQPHHQMLAVGVVMSILGAQVIVEVVEKHDPLNEGSILWITESRTPLGLVDEIFGPVKNPYYVVRYNSENEIPEGIHVGTKISFVPEFADHVLNNKDLYKKGYDASGANDEEMTDEEMFSDDEKEEFARSHRMTKRGINDQNPRKMRNNRKKVPQKESLVPTYPVGLAATSSAHGNCSTFLGTGQGTFVPPFQPPTAGLNPLINGIWTKCTTFPQPQSSMFPNALTSMFPQENTQNSYQLPVPGIPFQQQVNLSSTMLPGMQPNIYRQPMFPPGLLNQNQMTFGLSPHPAQMQPPLCAEQGFLSNEWLERNNNPQMHSGTNPGRSRTPHQFHGGTPANRGRKAIRRGGRKGWRPA